MDSLFVHLPFRRLEQSLPLLLQNRLQPEIAFRGPELDTLDFALLRRVRRELEGAGLRATIHAPFLDLNPGSFEPLVREASLRRALQTLAAAGELGARLVVFHPGYDHWRYGKEKASWLEQSRTFWGPLADHAARSGCLLALENIFEQGPDLLAAVDSPQLGHCFDVGHWHIFSSTPLPEWFSRLGPRTVHLHLHDNGGTQDDHLPIGEGRINFAALFDLISGLPAPPSMTLEAHDEAALFRSLAAVAPFLRS